MKWLPFIIIRFLLLSSMEWYQTWPNQICLIPNYPQNRKKRLFNLKPGWVWIKHIRSGKVWYNLIKLIKKLNDKWRDFFSFDLNWHKNLLLIFLYHFQHILRAEKNFFFWFINFWKFIDFFPWVVGTHGLGSENPRPKTQPTTVVGLNPNGNWYF